jgi:energy-coupling factor transport system permease protein
MAAWAGLHYRRLPSPLHAARASIAAAWAAALIVAALVLTHPLVLGALLLAVVIAAAGAGLGGHLARSMRTAAIVAVPIVLVNVVVSRQGLTVFARIGDLGPFGDGHLTVEALAYGGVIALKVTLVILLTTLASLAIDPDELLQMARARSYRGALTASLALRMVPLLAADAERLAEAQRTRPRPPRGARGRVLVIAAVIASALDRAQDVAATLEVRGLASPPRERPRRRARRRSPLSRHDVAFLASALALAALVVAGGLSGVAAFSAYPLVHAPVSAGTLALAGALLGAALLPFCDRRGVL